MATGRLHGFPQSHQADRALVLALQGRVELHIVPLDLFHEGAGQGPCAGAGHPAHTVILCCSAAGAGHGSAAVTLRLAGSTAVFTV